MFKINATSSKRQLNETYSGCLQGGCPVWPWQRFSMCVGDNRQCQISLCILLFSIPAFSLYYRFSDFSTFLSNWFLCFQRIYIPREAIIPLSSRSSILSLANIRVLHGMQQAQIHDPAV